jgi:diguanylate cyclase (GGDEF)-like protein
VPIYSDVQQIIGHILTVRDVTQQFTDGLTHLYTKNFVSEYLKKLLSQSLRTQNPFTLLMIDLDHFKMINDKFGHLVGDLTLYSLAEILRNSLRAGDIAGRFGGDEFIVILSHTDSRGAETAAERIRKKTAETELNFEGNVLKITVSIGASTFNPEEQSSRNGVYFAKARGRNQVCQFEWLKANQNLPPVSYE